MGLVRWPRCLVVAGRIGALSSMVMYCSLNCCPGPTQTSSGGGVWCYHSFWKSLNEARVSVGVVREVLDLCTDQCHRKPATFATLERKGKKKLVFALPGWSSRQLVGVCVCVCVCVVCIVCVLCVLCVCVCVCVCCVCIVCVFKELPG